MGFSPLGLLVSISVLAPILILIWRSPGPKAPATHVPLPLAWLERAGQALCLVVPAITLPGRVTWWWAILAALALSGYYALWIRYLLAGRRLTLLYAPVWRMPVPMAILPVSVFLSAAAWLGNPWIAVAALVLAAGHIPVSILTGRAVQTTP